MTLPLIVVVDDSEEIRDVVRFVLEHDGFRVTTYGDANQAFEAIRRERPELVITDLMLGPTSGLELITRLRSDLSPPVPPIVACSGFDRFGDEALARGADAFIPKPFELGTLLDTIRAVLAKRPLAREENEDANLRSRRLRRQAVDAAQEVLQRLEPRLPDLTQRSAWTTAWLPAYLGFGHALDAVLREGALRITSSSDQRRWPIGRAIDDLSLCRDVLESSSTLVLPNLEILHASVTSADGTPLQFFAGVPLLARRTTIGALCLTDDEPRRLEPEDLTLMHGLAQRASEVLGGSDNDSTAIWTPSGQIAAAGLKILLASELLRAARQGLALSLLVWTGAAPSLAALPPRTAVADLGSGRFALLMVRPEGPSGRHELVRTVRQIGFDAGGLLTVSGDALLPSGQQALDHAHSLCDRALHASHGTVERVVIRREPLPMSDTLHAC